MSGEPRLRVAAIILEYCPLTGGAQNQLKNQAARMAANGIDLTVITRRYDGLDVFELIDGVPVHRLPAPQPKALASLVFSYFALKRIKQTDPDIIHAFSLFSPSTIAALAAGRLGIPAIVKVLRSGELGDVTRLLRKPGGRQRLASYGRRFGSFLSISTEIVDELVSAGISRDKCRVIPNGVDTDLFTPVAATEKAEIRKRLRLTADPLVIYSGRLVAEKRVSDLLDVWSDILGRFPGAGLVVVGDGPERERLEMRQCESVRFAGNVDNVVDYLHAADAFVLPSDCEGLSNAMLEAMSCALPCIVSSVGGAPDVITHLENGWLFSCRDKLALTEALVAVLENDGLGTGLGAAARKQVTRTYDLNVTTDQLCNFYRELASR